MPPIRLFVLLFIHSLGMSVWTASGQGLRSAPHRAVERPAAGSRGRFPRPGELALGASLPSHAGSPGEFALAGLRQVRKLVLSDGSCGEQF